MKKFFVCLFVLLFFLLPVVMFFGHTFGIGEPWLYIIEGFLWGGSLVAFIGAMVEQGRTDGDLIAGAEDEDGLVFALKTPVDELVQKNKVIFHVLKDRK